MTRLEYLESLGPWNLSDETVVAEFHRLKTEATLIAQDADFTEMKLRELRRRGSDFLQEFAR